jgi:hypothetical protein
VNRITETNLIRAGLASHLIGPKPIPRGAAAGPYPALERNPRRTACPDPFLTELVFETIMSGGIRPAAPPGSTNIRPLGGQAETSTI